ncbi:MAG: DUF5021 domain-containing protein [Ruminococcaceae bacterium]|nr:DUF5021 domain-containing protein [Oscillospiraceae bacterium]
MKKHLRKKGFTLVELIVVIAIIGVLAAILVPTMMGFVRDSKITSANKVANEMSEALSQTLTKLDADGHGMKPTQTATSIITITVSNASGTPTWTTAVTDTANFISNDDVDWTATGTGMTSSDKVVDNVDVPQNLLSLEMMNYFPDLTNGYLWFAVSGGFVRAAYFNETGAAVPQLEAAFDTEGNLVATTTVDWGEKICTWDNEHNGITVDGLIVGTSPALILGNID